MKISQTLKDLLLYKEPKPYHQFELLEDEESEAGLTPEAPQGKDTASEDKDAASEDEDTAAEGDDTAAEDEDTSTKDKETGAEGEDFAAKAKDTAAKGKDSAPKGKDTASEESNSGQRNEGADSEKNKTMTFQEWNNKRASQNSEKDSKKSDNQSKSGNKSQSENKNPLSSDLRLNLKRIKKEMNVPTNQDVVIREFKVLQQCNAFIVFIDGMADKSTINDYILRQLMAECPDKCSDQNVCSIDFILENLLSANQVTRLSDYDAVIKQILNGLTAVFVEGQNESILVETRGYESRSVSTPVTESVVSGAQEGFVENLRTNLTLIRKIIKSKDLITEIQPVGRIDQINCAIVYMREIANPKVVEEVKRRIESLDIDFAIGDGLLDQLIEDHPFSLFPQIISTERPDRTASFLMDGKVAIISDGTPFASIVPITFFHMFHTSEDSTVRWQYGTFLRYIRLIASFFAAFLPGLYIALTLYHKDMIPTELLFSIHKARENVPFPTIVEVLLMEVSFEIIREAGIRVPGVVGQTLGIIGAIVLGQAAVSAGLVSPVLIIIVAITGLGSFTIPNYSLSFAIRIMRFIFIFLGAMAGFYGFAAGLFVLGGIACSMKSFGVPFFAPIAPKTKSSPDIVNRAPAWLQKDRPDFLNTRNRKRAGTPVRKWTVGEKGESSK